MVGSEPEAANASLYMAAADAMPALRGGGEAVLAAASLTRRTGEWVTVNAGCGCFFTAAVVLDASFVRCSVTVSDKCSRDCSIADSGVGADGGGDSSFATDLDRDLERDVVREARPSKGPLGGWVTTRDEAVASVEPATHAGLAAPASGTLEAERRRVAARAAACWFWRGRG